jgi:hypothetical protein
MIECGWKFVMEIGQRAMDDHQLMDPEVHQQKWSKRQRTRICTATATVA